MSIDKTQKVRGSIAIVILLIAFFAVKYISPSVVKSLYADGHFDVLNSLSGAKEHMALDFYRGRITETVIGPVSQILSALALIVFALLFLQNASLWTFGLAVFGYLLLTKFEVSFFPFYGDAVGGGFAEAWWLAKHHFNYIGLFHQAGYAQGGPKVYLFSLYPTYLAVLLTLIPKTKIFLAVNHVLVFLMGAGVISLMRKTFSRTFSQPLSILAALTLLHLPLFQSQVEAINMEMPCVLFLILCADALMDDRFHRAGIMAILAVLTKGVGIFGCAAFGMVAVGLLLSKRRERVGLAPVFWAAGLVIFSVLKVYSKFFLHDQHVSAGMVNFFAGLPSLEYVFITKVLFFNLFVITAALIFYKCHPWGQKMKRTATEVFHYPFYVMSGFVLMWFLLFLNFYAVSPRYRLTVYPFLLYMCFCAFYLLTFHERLRRYLMIGCVCLAAFSSYGFFTGTSAYSDQVVLEQSLEYRNDLFMKQRLCRFVEQNFSKFSIMAPFTISQMLAIPEAGYVSKHLDVYIYGFSATYAGIKEYPGLKNINVRRSIFVGLQDAKIDVNFPYPLDPHDIIIRTVRCGNKSAHVFMGGIGIERMYRTFYILQKKYIKVNGKYHARTKT